MVELSNTLNERQSNARNLHSESRLRCESGGDEVFSPFRAGHFEPYCPHPKTMLTGGINVEQCVRREQSYRALRNALQLPQWRLAKTLIHLLPGSTFMAHLQPA